MSHISKAVFGAIAVSLTLGAVQFASGHDLAERWQAVAEAQTTGIASAINRSAKADRASMVAGTGEQTQTVSLRPESLSDTTVLVRIPAKSSARSSDKSPETDARNVPAAPSLFKSGDRRKATVACEPMVSVLTEVAKQLQPGRCVT